MADGNKKTLVLLDTHAILHRAYHALPDFSTSKGEPTGALYGLTAMILKTINEINPDYIVACFDLPKPTFRDEKYKDYKAGRPKTDDALIDQLKRAREVFDAFGIPFYEKEGFEADDIIGTIAETVKSGKLKVESEGVDIIIASGDMDTLQLVDDEQVRVFTLKKGIQDTVIYNEEKVVERYGFAPEFLPDYKGLSGDPSDNIPGIKGIGDKTASILVGKFGTIEDIYETLKKDETQLVECGIKKRAMELLKEGEEEALFSKMLATIRRDAPIEFKLPTETWREAVDRDKLKKMFRDFEFRSLERRFEEYIDGGNTDKESSEENEEAAPDNQELRETLVALWVLNSSLTNPSYDDLLSFAGTKDFNSARKYVFGELEKQGLSSVFEKIEKPLIPIVDAMREHGISINVAHLKSLSKEYHKIVNDLESKIFTSAGSEFNVNSPKQLGEVLFDNLELGGKKVKKTSTGAYSTAESELEKLRGDHEIIDLILDYREYKKLLSTYIDNLPDMVASDGRLHATFLQTGTTTGRMASENPNLQNIPVKDESGRRIREAFVASEGFQLVAFDYSQIELRIAAILSGDEKLIKVFREDRDVHTAVASEVFDVSPDAVDKEMRRQAKVINFGIIYGMGVNALKVQLGTDQKKAKEFYEAYFNKFDGLKEYLEGTKQKVRNNGYTETLYGRRRYFEGIDSHIPYIRAHAERMAINAPIQGTQSDVIKLAMIEIDNLIQKTDGDKSPEHSDRSQNKERDAHLILQVHDELIYEVREEVLDELTPKIKKAMETVVPMDQTRGIPIKTDVCVGPNWGKMKLWSTEQ